MNAAGTVAVVACRDSEKTIDACLTCLRAAAGVVEIRVVDCNSRDTTLAIVQRHAVADARVRFIANPDDPGYAAACNQGVAASTTDWIALLQPGCMVERESLCQLRDVAAAGDRLVGGDVVDEQDASDPASRLRLADPAGAMWWAWLGFAACAPTQEPEQEVDAVGGGVLLLSRTRFVALGGLDTGYATRIAQVDLCRRACAAGATVVCANSVRIRRVRGLLASAHPVLLAWRQRHDATRHWRIHGLRQRLASAWLRVWLGFPLAWVRALARMH